MLVGASTAALTRFANNTIHQNVSEEMRLLSVRVALDGRTARASTNRLDNDSIRRVVEDAVALTRAASPDPELLPMAEPQVALEVTRFDAATAGITPEQRARAVRDAIRVVEEAGQSAAGIYSTGQSVEAIWNSHGVEQYHPETMARFSITATAPDSSGWAKASTINAAGFDPLALARSASEKARVSREPREIEPGKYTVVLEPAAVLDLVGQLFNDFSATAVTDQRSFLTDRMGEPLFGENFSVLDDVYHPFQAGPPFDGEGEPRRRLTLVEKGVPRQLAYSRASAHKAGVAPTGHGFPLPNEVGEAPLHIVIEGGNVPLEDMIASTERGVLVTRFWYIREVDPYEKIMTGMTRDGTFLIENGRVVCGLKNFRFNQSLIELLRNIESLSPSVRASGEEAMDLVAPAMKAHGFNFSELTKF